MHHSDPKDHKDKLYCAFCRNPLTNQEMIVKKFDGDFVSVWCEPCSKLDKQWGPKFLVCCCSEEPRELDVEMAKGEIEQASKQGIKIELEKPVQFTNIPFKVSEPKTEAERVTIDPSKLDDNKDETNKPKQEAKKGFKSKLRNL